MTSSPLNLFKTQRPVSKTPFQFNCLGGRHKTQNALRLRHPGSRARWNVGG